MPLTLCGFIFGIILLIFGLKRKHKLLIIIGIILTVLVLVYWLALLLQTNP